MITCSFILLSYAPFSFLCNHPSRPTFFGNSFLLSIGCICRNWQGCTSFTSYNNITLLLRLTKSSILTLSSDHKGISSVRHMNHFCWETRNTTIIKWWLISIPSDFSENNFSCWICCCICSWKEAFAQLAHLPPPSIGSHPIIWKHVTRHIIMNSFTHYIMLYCICKIWIERCE